MKVVNPGSETPAAQVVRPLSTVHWIAYTVTAILAILAIYAILDTVREWVLPRHPVDTRTASEIATAQAVELKAGIPAYEDASYAHPLGRVYPFELACYPTGRLAIVGRVNDQSPWMQIELVTGCGADPTNGQPLPAPGRVWINMNDLMLARESWASMQQADPQPPPPDEPQLPVGAVQRREATLTPPSPAQEPPMVAEQPVVEATPVPLQADAPPQPATGGAGGWGGFLNAIRESSALENAGPTAVGTP